MKQPQPLARLVLKAVAVATAMASVVLSILNVAPAQVHIVLLGIGLFALSLAALQKPNDE